MIKPPHLDTLRKIWTEAQCNTEGKHLKGILGQKEEGRNRRTFELLFFLESPRSFVLKKKKKRNLGHRKDHRCVNGAIFKAISPKTGQI